MSWLKFILMALGLIFVVLLAFSVIGIIYHALWYVFLFGIIAGGGYVGYKLLKKDDNSAKLEGKAPTAIAEMENADRTLEEYKRKYLAK